MQSSYKPECFSFNRQTAWSVPWPGYRAADLLFSFSTCCVSSVSLSDTGAVQRQRSGRQRLSHMSHVKPSPKEKSPRRETSRPVVLDQTGNRGWTCKDEARLRTGIPLFCQPVCVYVWIKRLWLHSNQHFPCKKS